MADYWMKNQKSSISSPIKIIQLIELKVCITKSQNLINGRNILNQVIIHLINLLKQVALTELIY